MQRETGSGELRGDDASDASEPLEDGMLLGDVPAAVLGVMRVRQK